MSKGENFAISNSNIIALWQLVLLSKNHEHISVKSAIEITINSGLLGGGLPGEQGLKLGQQCKLLEIVESKLYLSKYCREEMIPVCDTDEPNKNVFRVILYRYISTQNFEWLLFFNNDPEVFKIYIPDTWIQLLEGANLFEFEDGEVTEWWVRVFNRFQTYKEGQKVEIGKVAEKLTFHYEKERLSGEGFDNSHFVVKWASQINDRYGYDILSIRGSKLRYSFLEKDSIQIEVKSSVVASEETFRFYISKNEWNVALKNMGSYFFYCWISTSLEKETAKGPYIIPAEYLTEHIPTDKGAVCEWSECRLIVDLTKMAFV